MKKLNRMTNQPLACNEAVELQPLTDEDVAVVHGGLPHILSLAAKLAMSAYDVRLGDYIGGSYGGGIPVDQDRLLRSLPHL